MRIVVFGNCSGFGGAQTAFRRLVEFLIEDRHLVGVIGLGDKADQLPMAERAVFATRIGSQAASPVRKLGQTLRAALRARRHRPEIFIAVGLANSAAVIARVLPRRTFRVCQDFIFGRRTNDPLLVSANRTFDALAVQSPSMLNALQSQLYRALPVAYLPCFPNPSPPGGPRIEQSNERGIRLSYFGRLASNKGLDMLLSALARAHFSTKVTLDIWGEGNELEKLKQLASIPTLDLTVAFRGRYPDGIDYARLISSYDGLVLPTTGLEGLPLILLEAMACGVPFLTTRVGAIPDCCVENEDVVLVEPNTDALRIGLERFVDRALAKEFSRKRLMHYFESRFGFDVMANRWREMIADPRAFFSHA